MKNDHTIKPVLQDASQNDINLRVHASHTERIVQFYREATGDYKTWSTKMHMHYGYMKTPLQFFSRERMLDEMVLQAVDRANLKPSDTVIDLGCGVGTSLRLLSREYGCNGVGVTIAGNQVALGKKLNMKEGTGSKISLLCADYHKVPLPEGTFEHAISLESICHSPDKQTVLNEAFRVLKPGGTFAVTDCFRKRTTSKMNRITRWGYNKFRRDWAVDDLDRIDFFVDRMRKAGFRNITVRNVSARVAPSLLYSPFLVAAFVISRLLTKGRIGRESRKNLEAVLLSIIIGMNQHRFGYYIIRAEKPHHDLNAG